MRHLITRLRIFRNLVDPSYVCATVRDYKVYVIDEVHMFLIAALPIALKTLEEPKTR